MIRSKVFNMPRVIDAEAGEYFDAMILSPKWSVATRVRQLNAQVIDCYERGFKNVYYKRESCCGWAGFFRFRAAKTRLCISERREIPLIGCVDGLIRI